MPPLPFRHIAVEGPIGVGKTSLVNLLAKRFRGTKVLEDVDNPFLAEFYKDKRGAAFRCQLFFLLSRYDQQRSISQRDLFTELILADYSFPKDKIFAYMTLEDSELMIYNRLYEMLRESVPRPDLVIYLQAPVDVLMERVARRGIRHEQLIERSYLERIADTYARFFLHYDAAPLLIVNTAAIDLANSQQDYEQLFREIQRMRRGRQYFNPAPSGLER